MRIGIRSFRLFKWIQSLPALPGSTDGRWARYTLIALAAFCLFPPPAAAQRTSIPCPSGDPTVSWLTFGSPNLAATISSQITCTARIRIPKGTPFITIGFVETYNYVTDADADFCKALSCAPVTQTLSLTGPSGAMPGYPYTDSGAVNVAPTGSDWQISGPFTLCFDGSCSNNYEIWGFPPSLGTHQLMQASKRASQFFDTAAMAKDADAFLDWKYTLDASKNWLPLSISVFYYTPVQFQLSHNRDYSKPYQFRPRDAGDPAAACDDYPDDCRPTLSVFAQLQNPPVLGDPNAPLLQISLTLTLETPKFRQTWLAGSSTNFGSSTTADPDYIFEASRNPKFLPPSADGLSMTLQPVKYGSYPVVVTSRDYGGAVNVKAQVKVVYGGTTYTYDVPVANPLSYPEPTPWTGPACAGSGSFLPLPLDTDCNGIADWWEGQYTTPAGGHLDPKADDEAGYGPNSPKGDGWPAHDEYRGFHFVADDGVTVRWASTDPVNNFDLFFWDQTNHYTQRLRDILARQGTDAERQANSFKLVYRRVKAAQANAVDPKAPAKGANRMNTKSIIAPAKDGFAIVYAEQVLNPAGVAGESTKLTLGRTPNFHNDGSALFIDPAAINKFLSQNAGFPLTTLTAQVVAHETGHHFGRFHPQRPGCTDGTPHCAFVALADASSLPTLSMTQFGFVGVKPDGQGRLRSSTLYIRLSQYLWTVTGKMKDADDLESTASILVSGVTNKRREIPGMVIASKSVALPDPVNNTPVFKVSLNDSLDSTASVYVQNQRQRLMDWTPYLNWTAPDQWRFADDDLQQLCVRKVCSK